MAREAGDADKKDGAGGPRRKGRMGGDDVRGGDRRVTRKGRKKSTERRGQRSKTWSPTRRGETGVTAFKSAEVKQEVVSEDERRRAKAQQSKLPLDDWKENADRERRNQRVNAKAKLDVIAKVGGIRKKVGGSTEKGEEGGEESGEGLNHEGKDMRGKNRGDEEEGGSRKSDAGEGCRGVEVGCHDNKGDESSSGDNDEDLRMEEVEVFAVKKNREGHEEIVVVDQGCDDEMRATLVVQEAMEEEDEQEELSAEDMEVEEERASGKRKGRERTDEGEEGERKKRGERPRGADVDGEEMGEVYEEMSEEEFTCRSDHSSESDWSVSSRKSKLEERAARRRERRRARGNVGSRKKDEREARRRGGEGQLRERQGKGKKRKGTGASGNEERADVKERHNREDRDRREKEKESNPALKFVLQKRGMADIGKKLKIQTDLTIEMFYKGEEATMNPRKKMEDLMERMTQEDLQIEFLAGDGQADVTGGTLDDDEFHRMVRLREIKKRTSLVAKVTMRSSRLLRSMKHENGGKFVRWLTKERIVMNIDRWSREPYADIGFFILRHPTATWKSDMEEEIREKIRKDSNKVIEEIPKFILYHGKKAFGTGEGRVVATVMFVQCKAADAPRLKELLGRGKSTRKLAFIPAGYHLQTSPKRVIKALNEQNRYVNAKKMIAVIGISEDQMNMTISQNGEAIVVKDFLKRKLGVEYIERTNRTKDIGKWLLIAESRRSDEIKQNLDQVLDEIGGGLKESGISDSVGVPRRTDRSMTEMRYKKYIDSLEEIIPDTEDSQPVIQVQNRSRARMNEDRNSGGPMKTFSEAVKKARQSKVEPNRGGENSQAKKKAEASYEERAQALRDQFEEKLNAHMKLSEDRILQEAMESQARLVKTLETHSEKSRKIMQSMVSQTEEKIEILGSQMNEKIEEVSEMYRALTGQFSELEKLVRAVVTQGQGVEITPTKTPMRNERGATGEWNERTRKGISQAGQNMRGE